MLRIQGDVAVITISNPPENAVGPGVPEAIQAALTQALADPGVSSIVLIGAGNTFIAGADLNMISAAANGEKPLPDLNSFLFAIEQSPKPVIAAIHGTALGGGLETAMSAH